MLAYFLKMHSEFLVPQQFEVQESSIQIPFSLLLIKCSNSCFFSAEEWHNLSHAGCLNGLSKYISIAKKSVFQFISSPSSLLLKFTQESQSGLRPTFQCWICLSKLTYLTGRSCCASLDLLPSTQSIHQVTLEGDTRWEKLWISADFVTMMVRSPLLSADPQDTASHFASLSQACAYPEFPHLCSHAPHSDWCQLVLSSAVNMGMSWSEIPHHSLYTWLKSVPVVFAGSVWVPGLVQHAGCPPSWTSHTVWLLSTEMYLLWQKAAGAGCSADNT